jgi:GATA-binding protein
MKKSVIKRRKRVVPAAQATQASGFDIANNVMSSTESDFPSPRTDMSDQRGSANPDGSINLGFRPRHSQPEPRMLPEPLTTIRNRDGQQIPPSSDLTAYASHHQTHQLDNSSLTRDNRLPPMTSYPSPNQRRPSLSPNSFLSPSRKRSFNAADTESPALHNDSNSKRLSSIKSILNPSQQLSDNDSDSLDPSLRVTRSPGPRYANAPSPNTSSYAPSPMSESERSKVERRAELQREAERMREALKAKERELAELNE